MSTLRFVGLDVHKDAIAIAVADEGQSEAVTPATIPHDVPNHRSEKKTGSSHLFFQPNSS